MAEHARILNQITPTDVATLLGEIYHKAYNKGRADQRAEEREAKERRNAFYDAQRKMGKTPLDIAMRDREVRAEFDRRVTKALETAHAKWAARQAAEALALEDSKSMSAPVIK